MGTSRVDNIYMKTIRALTLAFCLFATACAAQAAQAATQCKVVNLMPDYWAALKQPDAAAVLRKTVVDPHPDLYNANYVDLPVDGKWIDKVARERSYAEAHVTEIGAVEQYLARHVPEYMAGFSRQFSDYRCDFIFYIAPSFGNMDGSAASVHGEHRIIFAPDVIPRYHQLGELKVLIDHETFHIYHHQATTVFGAPEEALPSVLTALWTEGLATFVSWRMNPDVSLDTALLQPGIPEGTKPHLAAIAEELAAHLDDKDEAMFGRYFMAGRQAQGYPPRAGYYVGMLVSQRLAEKYSLRELAHLPQDRVRELVAAELQKLSSP
jgi:hypothetical protein